jgi:hypothetical protein
MCGSQHPKNQTPHVVWQTLKKVGHDPKKDKIKGVGIFIVPDPEAGILEYRSIFVDGLEYTECKKRGNNCVAFQWIPLGYRFETKSKVYELHTLKDVQNIVPNCGDPCGSSCEMGCVCFDDNGSCEENP